MKLHDLIGISIRPQRYVIQFSPIRTGSALIYNVIRECLPDKVVKKVHTFDKRFECLPIISTIRQPLDCLASILRFKGVPVDEKSIAQAVAEFDASGINDLMRITDLPNTLLFKYKDFIKDLNPVFEAIESSFQIEVPDETRDRIIGTYSAKKMAKASADLGEFANWGPVTKIHGNHISDTLGKPRSHKQVFTPDHIQGLKRHYRGLMERFTYE